jgi:hypothetical protein
MERSIVQDDAMVIFQIIFIFTKNYEKTEKGKKLGCVCLQ